MKVKRILATAVAATLAASAFASCGKTDSSNGEKVKELVDGKELTVIKALADLTPHSELIEYVEPKLNEKGYTVEIVSTGADATWNEKTQKGEYT